jgi:hypothetical protein
MSNLILVYKNINHPRDAVDDFRLGYITSEELVLAR